MRMHYHSGPSSARVRPAHDWPGYCTPGHENHGLHVLYHLETERTRRRMGFAGRVMRAICHDADAEGVRMVALVGGRMGFRDKPMTDAQLVSWYERFLFQRWYPVSEGPSIGGIVIHRWPESRA